LKAVHPKPLPFRPPLGQNGVMNRPDRIQLTGLSCPCIIGIFDWERKRKQTVVVDLTFPCDNRRAARTDRIEDASDYKKVAKAVLAFVGRSRYGLVETLAEELAAHLLDHLGLREVTLRVSKPGAIRHSSNVGVEITRARATGKVYFSLGSNLDPQSHLRAALRDFQRDFSGVHGSSPYVTSPVGTKGQPDFWNLVLGLETGWSPARLEAWTARLEKREGRVRGKDRNGPRTLDVDLLDYDGRTDLPTRKPLPHPDIEDKAFVLFPFLEIAPRWIHPRSGLTLVELAARFKGRGQKIRRLDPGVLGIPPA